MSQVSLRAVILGNVRQRGMNSVSYALCIYECMLQDVYGFCLSCNHNLLLVIICVLASLECGYVLIP